MHKKNDNLTIAFLCNAGSAALLLTFCLNPSETANKSHRLEYTTAHKHEQRTISIYINLAVNNGEEEEGG